jgi:signal transduction histidine kinase
MDSTIFEGQHPAAGKAEAGESSRPSAHLPRLLVVDDDEGILRYIRRVLTSEYQLALASDGEEALRMAIADPPDLILSDFGLPKMTGGQLLRAVRAHPALQNIPFIVLTALEDHQLRLELLGEGAQDFLVKPFSVEELRVRLANLLHMKVARDLLQEELDSRSGDVKVLIAEVAARRAALQVAEEEARTATRAKSDFLALVSHELKTPLTTLRLSTDLWRRRKPETGLASDAELRRFTGSIDRLEWLVDSLLEAARVQSGRLELRIEEIDLLVLIEQLALDFEMQMHAKKELSLRIDVADDARRIQSDRRLLWLIISNLLGNAVKYTDTGVIEIRVRSGEGTVIEVRDPGPGISPEDSGRIFEPFVHLERLENKSIPGMGLGLALVRDMTAALGGQVRLESELGAGSTFSVTLP